MTTIGRILLTSMALFLYLAKIQETGKDLFVSWYFFSWLAFCVFVWTHEIKK